MKEYEGRYFGLPVKVKLLDNDGLEITSTNWLVDKLIIPATYFENMLNIVCSSLFENYEPHFRVKIKIDK